MGKTMKKIFFIIISISLLAWACDDSSSNDVAPASIDGNSEVPLGQGGSLARFGILGNNLYAVNWNTLNTFDISDPAKPNYLSNTQVGAGVETIFIRSADSVVFIGSQTGMYIYGASNPQNLQFLSFYDHFQACDPVVANMDYAFVTLNDDADFGCARGVNQLEIINIKNLTNPFVEQVYSMTQPRGLGLDDSLLFVCDDGLKVFDFNSPQDLRSISNHNISARDVIPNVGNFDIIYVIGDEGLYQYQYRDADLELLSIIPLGS
jgi:hypothetical protein